MQTLFNHFIMSVYLMILLTLIEDVRCLKCQFIQRCQMNIDIIDKVDY